jgi:hypothetical protein
MEDKSMRKMALCFLLLLCPAIAFGQQPQWTTVASVVLFNQSQGIPRTTIFTPTEVGLYHLNFYFSTMGGGNKNQEGTFYENVYGADISGTPLGGSWDPTRLVVEDIIARLTR